MKNYFILAGEASGDLHGSRLIQALKENANTLSICGIGGPRMRQAGIECLISNEELQVMGFSDVLFSLPRLCKLFYRTLHLILHRRPDCVILIDYPGFNLRLAAALRKRGYRGKIVQYVCPSVWAHGKNRIQKLEAHFDLLLTIYPFEAQYFSKTHLKVVYIGNPLVETIHSHVYQEDWLERLSIPRTGDIIALFPGSRRGEILSHIPQQLQAAHLLKQSHPHLRFALSCAQENLQGPINDLVRNGPLHPGEDLFIIPPLYRYELMKHCKIALAKSGTVALELALHKVPGVIHYQLSTLNYLFAKFILKLQLPSYCIVNILTDQTLFPEFIGMRISPHDLKVQLEKIHVQPSLYRKIQDGCEKLKELLGSNLAHQCAAQEIGKLK